MGFDQDDLRSLCFQGFFQLRIGLADELGRVSEEKGGNAGLIPDCHGIEGGIGLAVSKCDEVKCIRPFIHHFDHAAQTPGYIGLLLEIQLAHRI